jgi:hypothetical protein
MANRYDSGTVSKFNPLSFQEIMFAPTAMRVNHDASIKRAEENTLQIDPLKEHLEESIKLKQDMNNKIRTQVDLINREGFNPNTTSQLSKINREFQDLNGPMGEVGKINASKIVYLNNQKEFLASAEKEGIGSEQALILWKRKTAGYTGYDEQGGISDVNKQGVAAKQDYELDISRAAALLGSTTTSEKSRGVRIVPMDMGDGTQMFVAKNSSGATVYSSNVDQVNASLKAINQKYHTSTGEGYLYNQDAGKDITQQRTNNYFASMLKTSTVDQTSESIQFLPKAAKAESTTEPPKGSIINQTSTLKSDAEDIKTYNDAKSQIKTLANSKSLNAEQRAKLEDLRELQANAESKMLRDKNYIKAQKEYYLAKENLSKNNYPKNRGAEGELAIRQAAVNRTEKEFNKIRDKYWQDSSSSRHNYSYLPSNAKEVNEWNTYNENIQRILAGVSDLGDVLDLTSITTATGIKKNIEDGKSSGNNDVGNVHTLIKNAKEGTFKINNIKVYGDDKIPEITATFTTLDTAEEYDMDRGLFSKGRTAKYGGKGKSVTVTFRTKRMSNSPDTNSAKGFKSLSGAISDFWKDKGGQNELTGNFQGEEVNAGFINSTYSDLTNEQLANRWDRDSDAQTALLNRAYKRGVTADVLVSKYKKDKK